MSLLPCPECGTKISNKARTCVYCGFESNDRSVPISLQDSYVIVPSLKFDIERGSNDDFFDTSYQLLSRSENQILYNFFGDLDKINKVIPGLLKVVQEIMKVEERLVAEIPDFIKKKLASGEWRLVKSATGEYFASVRGNKGIVKNLRLIKEQIPKDTLGVLDNLNSKILMNQLISEVESIGETINLLQQEIHNDRIAEADATLQMMNQIQYIQDLRIRESMIVNAITESTISKHKLMRNFSFNLDSITEDFKNPKLGFKSSKVANGKSIKALSSLQSIANLVQIETKGYTILGEIDAAKNTLLEFHNFIVSTNLNNRDVLLFLNENLPSNQIDIVDKFITITRNIKKFIDEEKQLSLLSNMKEEVLHNENF